MIGGDLFENRVPTVCCIVPVSITGRSSPNNTVKTPKELMLMTFLKPPLRYINKFYKADPSVFVSAGNSEAGMTLNHLILSTTNLKK